MSYTHSIPGSLPLQTMPTSSRQTSNDPFSTKLTRGIAGATSALGQAAYATAPYVPGAAVVSAALNGAAYHLIDGNNSAMETLIPTPSLPGALETGGTGLGNASAPNMTNLMGEMRDENSKLLAAQMGLQRETRKYDLASTVQSVRHKAMKDIIDKMH